MTSGFNMQPSKHKENRSLSEAFSPNSFNQSLVLLLTACPIIPRDMLSEQLLPSGCFKYGTILKYNYYFI